MPTSNVNTGSKKWYKVWWKVLVSFIGAVGIVWGVLEGVNAVTKWWHKEELKEQKIEELEQTLLKVINDDIEKDKRIDSLDDYVTTKKKSYAVGFRVFKETDKETGIVSFKKMYRDWQGIWHEVYLDREYSDIYGIDYYYYINKNDGRKTYCW